MSFNLRIHLVSINVPLYIWCFDVSCNIIVISVKWVWYFSTTREEDPAFSRTSSFLFDFIISSAHISWRKLNWRQKK